MLGFARHAPPASFTLEFRVYDPADRTGLARRVVAVSHYHLAVVPSALVDKLAFDLAHAGVGLGLWRPASHHPGHVQVLYDKHPVLSDKGRGHLVMSVASETGDSSLEPVDALLSLVPSSASGPSAGLGPLPAAQLSLGPVVRLWILPGLALGVGSHRAYARVHGSGSYAGVGVRLRRGRAPVLYAQDPSAVPVADVRLVWDARRQRVGEFHRAEQGQLDTTLPVVPELRHAGARAERARSGPELLSEPGRSCRMVGVAPVPERGAEVHERALLDTAGYLTDERIVLALGGVEGFVEVLPGGPGHPVGAAESVSSDAEVVDEARYADGTAAVSLLPDRETDGHRVTRRHPAFGTG